MIKTKGIKEPKKTGPDLLRLLDTINEKFGEKSIIKASEIPSIKRWQTGIFDVDYILGGGFPMGRINMIWGKKSTAKTTLTLLTCKEILKYCRFCKNKLDKCECKNSQTPRIVYLDAEGTFSGEWVKQLNIPDKDIYVVQVKEGERALDIGVEVIESGECDVMVLDSVAQLSPEAELDSSISKSLQATGARMMNKSLRVWVSAMNTYNDYMKPTIFLINQEREKIGILFGDPAIKPFGKGQDFASSTELYLFGGSNGGGKIEFDKNKEPLSTRIKVICNFNKTAPPKKSGEFSLVLQDHDGYKLGEIKQLTRLIKVAQDYGVMAKDDKTGKWTYRGTEFSTLKAIKEVIRTGEEEKNLTELLVNMATGNV